MQDAEKLAEIQATKDHNKAQTWKRLDEILNTWSRVRGLITDYRDHITDRVRHLLRTYNSNWFKVVSDREITGWITQVLADLRRDPDVVKMEQWRENVLHKLWGAVEASPVTESGRTTLYETALEQFSKSPSQVNRDVDMVIQQILNVAASTLGYALSPKPEPAHVEAQKENAVENPIAKQAKAFMYPDPGDPATPYDHAMHIASGELEDSDPLVSFIYDLTQDSSNSTLEARVAATETLFLSSATGDDVSITYDNGWRLQYARYLANRIYAVTPKKKEEPAPVVKAGDVSPRLDTTTDGILKALFYGLGEANALKTDWRTVYWEVYRAIAKHLKG